MTKKRIETPELIHVRDVSEPLRLGETVFLDPETGETTRGGRGVRLRYPRLRVYTGTGASHSWLWFAETLERLGFYDVGFVDEGAITEGWGLAGADTLLISGGDTFAVARALGEAGSVRLADFVEGGGTYIGSCAGAYLPLRSSKPGLDRFNFVPARITNLADRLPEPLQLEEKLGTPYGCCYIYHAVREDVRIETTGIAPAYGGVELTAPLYGGPPMDPYEDTVALARYTGFTEKTRFLVDPDLAGRTILGRAAAVMREHGAGRFLLFGPHVEHPGYPRANRLLADAVFFGVALASREENRAREIHDGARLLASEESARAAVKALRRSVSNARIAATSLERRDLSWTIGAKVYEPGKVGAFLDPVWRRLGKKGAMRNGSPPARGPDLERLVGKGREAEALVKRLAVSAAAGEADDALAAETFRALKALASRFLSLYFQSRLREDS